jgi:hypothetical protein
MGLTVRQHHNVSGDERDASSVALQADVSIAFGDEMENNHVFRLDGQVGCHRAGIRLTRAPGRREFPVEEHGAIELHSLEYFRQHIHAKLPRLIPAVRYIMPTRRNTTWSLANLLYESQIPALRQLEKPETRNCHEGGQKKVLVPPRPL